MDTPVMFLDGDLRNAFVFGIGPGSIHKHPIPPHIFDCDCLSCQDEGVVPHIVEGDVEEYHVIQLGRYVRIGAKDRKKLEDKDRLLFELVAQISHLELAMPRSEMMQKYREQEAKRVEEFRARLATPAVEGVTKGSGE